jgi:UDP-2,3-diacylglucosamine pyrophosphatase LpxH
MTLVDDGFSTGLDCRPFPGALHDAWRVMAFRRLDQALATAVPIPIDDNSRYVFFGDCHRGDGSSLDAFARNKSLFLRTLGHYFDDGYTYVEVGDGDELWVNGRFDDILTAQRDVFDLLHAFDNVARLFLLVGNHDTFSHFSHQGSKDGIPTYHSLLLQHENGHEVFVAHGHQADLTSSHFYALTRLLCRSVWRNMQQVGSVREYTDRLQQPDQLEEMQSKRYPFTGQGKRIEGQLIDWTIARRRTMVCGHTHLPTAPGREWPSYFNCGSCVSPGYITGVELTNGELGLVRWSLDRGGRPQRHQLARPRAIASLASPGAAR